MNTRTMRRGCFKGEDDGFGSIPINNYQTHQPAYMINRRTSLRNISSLSTTTATATATATATLVYSPRSTPLHSPHFLESCSLCRKPLAGNRDIFMYRGDTPFCSEECRQEQIEMDEVKEKKWNLKSLRTKNESRKSSSSESENYSFRKTTLAAA